MSELTRQESLIQKRGTRPGPALGDRAAPGALAGGLARFQSRRMRTVRAVFPCDGRWFIARGLDFPVTAPGKTLEAAKKNLREAVELHVET